MALTECCETKSPKTSTDDVLSPQISHDIEKHHGAVIGDVERLGRIRPDLFATAIGEVSFVAIVIMSLMTAEYFTSGFNTLLPHLSKAINIPDKDRTWPTAMPNLAASAFLLPFARLCDRYGGRAVFLGGHAWLFVWSVACGFSSDLVPIIVCRSMQGIGFAAFLPANLALLGHIYRPGPRKNLVYCIYGAFSCVGFYVGILSAGISIELLSWRWYFWIGSVIEFIIVVAGLFAIPRQLNDVNRLASMDWWGLCTITPGLALMVFAFTGGGHAPDGWRTPYIYVSLTLGILLLLAAVYTQGWVASQPLLPKRLFQPKFMARVMGSLYACGGCYSCFLFYSSL